MFSDGRSGQGLGSDGMKVGCDWRLPQSVSASGLQSTGKGPKSEVPGSLLCKDEPEIYDQLRDQ